MLLSYSVLLVDRQALSEHTTTSSSTESLGQALRVSLVKPGAYLSESYGPVAAYARRLRQAQGLAPGQRCPRQPLPSVAEPPCQPLPPRRATWLVLRRATERTEAETQPLAQFRAQPAAGGEGHDPAAR